MGYVLWVQHFTVVVSCVALTYIIWEILISCSNERRFHFHIGLSGLLTTVMQKASQMLYINFHETCRRRKLYAHFTNGGLNHRMMVIDSPRNCVARDLIFFRMLTGVCDNVYVYWWSSPWFWSGVEAFKAFFFQKLQIQNTKGMFFFSATWALNAVTDYYSWKIQNVLRGHSCAVKTLYCKSLKLLITFNWTLDLLNKNEFPGKKQKRWKAFSLPLVTKMFYNGKI